jgi:hypothetical protein
VFPATPASRKTPKKAFNRGFTSPASYILCKKDNKLTLRRGKKYGNEYERKYG